MESIASLISFSRTEHPAVYIQISNRFIHLIQQGVLQPGTRLPGSRSLALLIGVNRLTVTKAYDELVIQGWIEGKGSKGMFVCSEIPTIQANALISAGGASNAMPGYDWQPESFLTKPRISAGFDTVIDEGLPDIRLLPAIEIARAYRAALRKSSFRVTLTYGEIFGSRQLRTLLTEFIRGTRGIPLTESQCLITRGSTMGIYLSAKTVLGPGDTVVTGSLSYPTADLIFRHCGARILRIPIDEGGIRIDALQNICSEQQVRMIYVTPHHHYPTTATMPAERRVQLLQLAREHQFCILEDDYDYDFQYDSNPVMPLASADTGGHVIYVGSFSKSIAPALRIGFVVAPSLVIESMGKLRRIIDRQGDQLLESVFIRLFRDGEIQRHLRKAQKVYHQRRDYFCGRLRADFEDVISFQRPAGGMAVWANFTDAIPLRRMVQDASKEGFYLPDPQNYSDHLNATRLGFASQSEREMDVSLSRLRELIRRFVP
ncbi:MAG: PLP-dependent aminotransferase family protein [Saprospiraceae bacterium]|nr:PLP-dependent aminotransferase family protein [Saprospiraceae bacterium]MCB9319302.1 PLP-dependent aminotransferase family protein [Lewinellaceae bacterium]